MNICKINPYIRHVMHSELQSNTRINRRIILDYELLYIESGELLLTYNDKELLFNEGDILLLCPNIAHSFHVLERPLSQPHIHFDVKYDSQSKNAFICFQDYSELSQEERQLIRENIFPNLEVSPLLKISDKESFLKLFYEIIDNKDIHSLSCKAKMLCLLDIIISDNDLATVSLPSSPSNIAFLVKSYIDANYEQSISLHILERQFDYSKYYIEKLFKQEYGISVIGYHNKTRLEAAVTLLKEYSVSKTAQMLGFSSIYSFSRAFRSKYGVSPSKYTNETDL